MSQDPKALALADTISSKIDKAQGLFASPPAGSAETYYCLASTFSTLPNKLVFAKASTSPSPARVFQVGSPTSYRVVNWVARRVNCPPASPQPEDGDEFTLLYSQINGCSPGVGADGITKFYEVSGTYVYVKTDSYGTSDSYPMGVPPIYTYSVESATIDPDDFVDTVEGVGEPPNTTGGSSSQATPPSQTPAGSLSKPTTLDGSPPGGKARRMPSLFDG